MRRLTVGVFVAWLATSALMLALTVSRACGDELPPEVPAPGEVLRHRRPATLVTESGRRFALPPGYAVPEERWSELDRRLRELEDAETRYRAENERLRREVDAGPGKLWRVVLLSLGAGLALGVGIGAVI